MLIFQLTPTAGYAATPTFMSGSNTGASTNVPGSEIMTYPVLDIYRCPGTWDDSAEAEAVPQPLPTRILNRVHEYQVAHNITSLHDERAFLTGAQQELKQYFPADLARVRFFGESSFNGAHMFMTFFLALAS